MTAKQIFTSQTTNGSSLEFSGNGLANMKISGTFGTGSIDLESRGDGANDSFSTTGDTAITAPGAWNLKYAPGIRYRLTLSGVAGTNINAFISQ
jgi:hypothetical protein